MFVIIVQFPAIREGKEGEFREWFRWSNDLFTKLAGFVSRRLLRPIQGGNYISIVELESQEAFQAMQASPEHTEAARRAGSFFEGGPNPRFYEVEAV